MTIADRPPHRSVQARLRIRLLTKDAWAAAPARGENPQLDRTQFGNASPLKERSLRPAQRGNKPRRVESKNLPARRAPPGRQTCMDFVLSKGDSESIDIPGGLKEIIKIR